MDDPRAWADSIIAFLTWTGGVMPIPMWQVILLAGVAVWVVYAIRAWRSGR